MKQKIKYLIIILTLLGCSKTYKGESIKTQDSKTITSAIEQNNQVIKERKLIKKGDIEFESDNSDITKKNIFKAVEKYKGYIASDKEFELSGQTRNTLIIRVPAYNFNKLLLEATQGVKKFKHKNINVEDVTEQFLDIQARLKTKKELEQRYSEILKQAKNVTEILEIEKQIEQIRATRESFQGRLKYLQNNISLSTLTITFYETNPTISGFSHEFKESFKNGWENLIWFLIMIINIWPFILILLSLIFTIKFYKKRKKK